MTEFIASLIVLIFLGMLNAIYLSWKHIRKEPLSCPINHDCNAVTESKWSNMLGIRNENLGAAYYLIILVLFLIWIYTSEISIAYMIFLGGIISVLYSAFLVYIQKFKIKQYCFYCLISALINLLILVNEIYLFMPL